MITIHRQICTFLLISALCLLSIGTYANFDPTNPPEPYVTYDVTVGVTPSEAGKATGAGKYLVGDKATIKTTANKNYKFQYWTINGYAYPETATSFRRNILEKGGSDEPMELYRRFRGADPDSGALLRGRGL